MPMSALDRQARATALSHPSSRSADKGGASPPEFERDRPQGPPQACRTCDGVGGRSGPASSEFKRQARLLMRGEHCRTLPPRGHRLVGYPQPDCRPGAGSAGTQPAGTGGALHGRGRIFCLGGLGLSASESARSYHQPGLHRHQSGRGVQGQDHGAQPALADRLHLSQGYGLGLVLSLHRAGRLLALHCRLEALRDDESAGRHRHARSGAGGVRARSDDRCSPTATLVG